MKLTKYVAGIVVFMMSSVIVTSPVLAGDKGGKNDKDELKAYLTKISSQLTDLNKAVDKLESRVEKVEHRQSPKAAPVARTKKTHPPVQMNDLAALLAGRGHRSDKNAPFNMGMLHEHIQDTIDELNRRECEKELARQKEIRAKRMKEFFNELTNGGTSDKSIPCQPTSCSCSKCSTYKVRTVTPNYGACQ